MKMDVTPTHISFQEVGLGFAMAQAVTGFSMQRPRFDLRSAHVAFVLDKSYWDMFHHVP
jgi:hypothetical protein